MCNSVVLSVVKQSSSREATRPRTYIAGDTLRKSHCVIDMAIDLIVVYRSERARVSVCISIITRWMATGNLELWTDHSSVNFVTFFLLLLFPCWTFWPPSINWRTLGGGQTIEEDKRGMYRHIRRDITTISTYRADNSAEDRAERGEGWQLLQKKISNQKV